MKAAVFEGNGKLVLQERPEPKIEKSIDVLVRVTGVGICGTDLHILQVPPAHPARKGIILGHEFSGEIVEIGSDIQEFKSGDRVLIDPHPGCGQCPACRQGLPDQCIPLIKASGEPGHPATIGIFSNGAMAPYAVVPSTSLYKVSRNVPAHIAALAEPFSCVVCASDKVKVQPGNSVVILGAGPIGLMFTTLLKSNGASKVIVSEPSALRRQAASQCGATRVVNPLEEDIEKVVKSETGKGADVVVEAVGPLLPLTLKLVRFGGTILQFGHDELARPPIPVGDIVRYEITIHGAFIGRFSFQKVAAILESGTLPLENIISHRMPLSEVHKGIELLRKGEAIKVILHPE
ncbi:MAG: alcohol dehydrogenase catalytic domain-containing protein [Spirochaetota bacterium]